MAKNMKSPSNSWFLTFILGTIGNFEKYLNKSCRSPKKLTFYVDTMEKRGIIQLILSKPESVKYSLIISVKIYQLMNQCPALISLRNQ